MTTLRPTEGPATFAFPEHRAEEVRKILAKYPSGWQASAILPLLDLAQRECGGWLPRAAMEHVAEMLAMPVIRVYEVASFYTMFNLRPVGRHLVQVCTTTPCWLRGSDDTTTTCKEVLGVNFGETSSDGLFTLVEVECLGACVNGPVVRIDDDLFEDLDRDRLKAVLDGYRRGERPRPGPQTARKASEPLPGRTTLLEIRGE